MSRQAARLTSRLQSNQNGTLKSSMAFAAGFTSTDPFSVTHQKHLCTLWYEEKIAHLGFMGSSSVIYTLFSDEPDRLIVL